MSIIAILMIIVVLLLIFWGKAKTMLIVILVLLAVAMGLEGFDYDADLGKLWETGSYSESRVENKNGVRLIGECISDNLNCANFDTQAEAQELYETCAAQIAENNSDVDRAQAKSLDVYGLDGDNDGIVCEALPAN